jgi:hypothetical protein
MEPCRKHIYLIKRCQCTYSTKSTNEIIVPERSTSVRVGIQQVLQTDEIDSCILTTTTKNKKTQ